MEYELSIIIPVFNKLNFTKSALEDLLKLGSNHQIIIIDNASTDGTEKYLRNMPSPKPGRAHFAYFRNSENTGFARACNTAYMAAAGQNIMFLNNDIRVSKNHLTWTELIIEACKRGELVSPTVGHLTNDLQFIKEDAELTGKNDYLSGWNLAASRKTFERLRMDNGDCPFSTEFGLAFFEDTDLSFRAKRLSPPIEFYVPTDIPVKHFGHVTAKDLDIKSLYTNAREIFVKKWMKK